MPSDEPAVRTAATPAGCVLVIDDERGPRESLRILLKTEFRVLCADSVDAGVELLKANAPDAVIMDIRMPGKSGIEGLRAIRAIDDLVAVIMFTGFGALETAQEAIRLGANDYLKKPFDAYEILAAVRRHINRAQAERRRRNVEKEMKDINRALKDEIARKSQLASLGQKSAELVHDLKNPLGAVLGYVSLLESELKASKDKLGERWQDTAEYLGSIEQSVLRCRTIADTWLDVSRGKMNRVPFDLRDMIAAVAGDCRYQAGKRGIRVDVEGNVAQGTLEGDRLQLTRALQNLLVNAIEAVPPDGGSVRLWCRDGAGDRVEMGVEDNGCGMGPDQLKRAFEPFFTTKAGSGTGLGLFIAKQAVEAHGGTIRMESEQGRGTRVTVNLPRH
jgi:signal transduction histidine kinase